MRILVIGGAGFIGSHVVDALLGAGQQVTIFGRSARQAATNLDHVKDNVRIVLGDLANKAVLHDAMTGIDIVYNFAWASTPVTSWQDPLREIDANIRLSVQVAEAAVEAGVKKLVFPSSGGTIYGPQTVEKINESCLPRPFGPYGIAKLSVEHFLNYFRTSSGLACDIYRIGNAFGPRQAISSPQGVIALWMGSILSGSPIVAYGDRETRRDYVYVQDIAHLMTLSLADLSASATLNIGSARGTSILDLLATFKDVIDVPFKYEILPRRPSDNISSVLDNTAILKHFPGFAFSDLREKIEDTWRALRLHQEQVPHRLRSSN